MTRVCRLARRRTGRIRPTWVFSPVGGRQEKQFCFQPARREKEMPSDARLTSAGLHGRSVTSRANHKHQMLTDLLRTKYGYIIKVCMPRGGASAEPWSPVRLDWTAGRWHPLFHQPSSHLATDTTVLLCPEQQTPGACPGTERMCAQREQTIIINSLFFVTFISRVPK